MSDLTYKEYIKHLTDTAKKEKLEPLAADILRAAGQVAELEADNKRLREEIYELNELITEAKERGDKFIEQALKDKEK